MYCYLSATSKAFAKSRNPPKDEDAMAPHDWEPDFATTNCRWDDCDREYKTQDELARVGNNHWDNIPQDEHGMN